MPVELSIIIPCFNCEKTLEEAVDSCFTQDVENFEIIMVDDGSTDGTRDVMGALARKHAEIRIFAHEKNQGGGATRNTGIQHSTGTYVYCLDSDNILSEGSLRCMIDFSIDEKIDGAAFYDRRFFQGKNPARYTSHINTALGRTIELGDLFNNTHTLLDNFLYTRESYDKTPGYPEHHGFDTQGFEVRYLSSGNTVRICPDTIFYHRRGSGKKSYFERVYESGYFSLNYALIFEDIFHLLSPSIRETIASFSLFQKNKLGEDNLLEAVRAKVLAQENIFAEDHDMYVIPRGAEAWVQDHVASTDASDVLTHAVLSQAQQDYTQALTYVGYSIASRMEVSPYLQMLCMRALQGLAGAPYRDIVTNVLADSTAFVPTPRTGSPAIITALARRHPRIFRAISRLRHRTYTI